MQDIHITGLSPDTFVRLKATEEFRREAAAWGARIGPQTTDNVDLIREDRER